MESRQKDRDASIVAVGVGTHHRHIGSQLSGASVVYAFTSVVKDVHHKFVAAKGVHVVD